MSTENTELTEQEMHDLLLDIDVELSEQRIRELTERFIDNLIMETYRLLAETNAVVAGTMGSDSEATTIEYDFKDHDSIDSDGTIEDGSDDEDGSDIERAD